MIKKKILHLITGLEIGGAEMMLLKTLPRLQNDFDNRVCCIRGRGPIGDKLQAKGIPVYYLDLKNCLDIRIAWKFRKIIKGFQPEILVTYLIHADLFGRIWGGLFGVKKIVCSQRGVLLNWEFLRKIDRITKFLVTKYTVQTETAKKELMRRLNLPAEKFEIIPNAIDLEEFNFEVDKTNKKREIGLDLKNIIITCVSKLRQGKGHQYLLKAFEEVHKIYPFINLLLVGDGEQKEVLLKQIENYQSKKNIYFLENRTDVKEILRISDIFVLATEGEGMSNALLEAMTAGLPIITTDIPENREIIENNKEGMLVPPKNPLALEKAIVNLINNPDLRNFLGRNAKRKIEENFDIEKVLQKISYFLANL